MLNKGNAMKLRTKKTEQWIHFLRDGGETRFLVSPMTESENADLLKLCRKFGWEKGQRFEDTPDYKSFKSQKIKKTILDWEGAENEDGMELDCTDENKLKIYYGDPKVVNWVLEEADKILEAGIKEDEADKANL